MLFSLGCGVESTIYSVFSKLVVGVSRVGNVVLRKSRKRLGRMRRVRRIGYIVPVRSGEVACKGEGKVKELKER